MADRNGLGILGGILASATILAMLTAFLVVQIHIGGSRASNATRHTSVAAYGNIVVQ